MTPPRTAVLRIRGGVTHSGETRLIMMQVSVLALHQKAREYTYYNILRTMYFKLHKISITYLLYQVNYIIFTQGVNVDSQPTLEPPSYFSLESF